MADELNPTTQSGGTESVVTPQNAAEGSQIEGGRPDESGAGDANRQDEKQKHAFNAAMAAARRKAEKETEERMNRQFNDDIRDQRIPNPTKPGTYFGSMAELKEYSTALRRADAEERAKKEGRSADEILQEDEDRAFIRDLKKREETSRKAQEEKNKQTEFIAKDIENFSEKYPGVDIEALDSNKAFRRFAGSRYGKEPLADLYADYVEIVGETKAAEAARRDDRANRSTGGGYGGGGGTLTADQRQRLKEWNENFPEMKMTEAEFLKRE